MSGATELRRALAEALHATYEAAVAFDTALERTDSSASYARLHAFRAEHERHAAELSLTLSALGPEPAAGQTEEGGGHFFSDYTAQRRQLGEEASLRGLCAVVQRAVAAYDACLAAALPQPLLDLLSRHSDRLRHQLSELQDSLAAHA